MALCYCITAPACRVMKKSTDKEKSKTSLTENTSQKSDFTLVDSSRKETKEFITYEFTFRDFEGIPNTDRNISKPEQDAIADLISTIEVDNLLDRVTSLIVKVDREEFEQKAIRNQGTEEKKSDKKETTGTKETSLEKESDSTWGANLPWYAWLIGAVLIFAIVWYLIKQVKPV